jgi:inorganic pyrophosphatase
MTDFNKILTPGEIENDLINVVNEIPMGSALKIEYRRDTFTFELDRIDPEIFAKPTNYGFIPQTLDGDGDELDVLLVCDQPLPTGIHLQARVIGVLNFEDDGEVDHKIIAVPADNRDSGDRISSVEDLGKRWMEKVEYHFNHYKDLKKPGTTKVNGWGDVASAREVIKECIERFANK